MKFETSRDYFEEACQYIPGGVNSPVRAFGSVGSTPIFVERGKGSKIIDVDGQEYLDFVCSWGPLILGHASDIASHGIEDVLLRGTTFGMPTRVETALAKLIVKTTSIEQVRMVSSGTEATMSALRLARGYTKKEKIIKFEGCYHGHSDGLLVKSGSGALTTGVPTSDGVPASIISNTLVAKFNDIDSVKKLIEENKDEIAAVIIEPIPGNMGLIKAEPGFLTALREVTEKQGIVLIFDEVISGYRIGLSGASGYYNIEPDLICLGKIIGGGMPVGAYGGKKEIMACIAPLGGVYQAGTLSGNPVAMTMGLNVLTHLNEHPEIYDHLESLAIKLEKGFNDNLKALKIESVTVNRIGGISCQFFAKGPINTYDDVMTSNTEQYAFYFNEMLQQGILLPPAQYECLFLSAAHTVEDIEHLVQCHYKAMEKVKNKWQEI